MAALGFGSPAIAQNSNCNNATPGDPIHCKEGASSTDPITIDVDGIDITTGVVSQIQNTGEPGVQALHQGNGNIDIDISGTTTTSTITTTGNSPGDAISALHTGTTGAITITVEDTEITTTGENTRGIDAQNRAVGNVEADLTDVTINTHGRGATGLEVKQQNAGTSISHAILTADRVTVTTRGEIARGLRATREVGPGDVRMTISNSKITTEHTGDDSYGIYGYKAGSEGDGSIDIDLTGGSTTTKGTLAFGVIAWHQESQGDHDVTGDITIDLLRHAVRTEGTGDAVGVRDDDATYSYGIYARHHNSGNININLGEGSSVTTLGHNSHGIVAYHFGTADTRAIDITVGGSVTVNGTGAQGVRVGTIIGGVPQRMAALDDEGYRRQTVRVDSSISSQGPGIYLTNGGRVVIGPQGSIDSASGIAILATGTVPEDRSDSNNIVAAIPPKLRVDMDLDGRQVSQVIGDNWIINDGGGTTLVVNGVKLHDATTGVVPGASAPNGAFEVRAQANDVRIREEGVRVLDRTDPDPANWVVSDPVAGVIADRDFSAVDFGEARLMFMEEYAPRSALYEALPDVLLRLQQRDAVRAPLSRPERSQWVRVTGRTGSQDFKRSTVGIEYDTDYFEIEAGKHVLLDNGLDAWVALYYLDGTAEVSSPMKGGDIDMQGLGLSLELCRGCESGDWYASGRLALARYDLDLSSDERGRLKSGVKATAWGLRLEAGRRLQRWNMQLTPRIRLTHANMSVDRFTDAVEARVSYSDEGRSAVALGVMAESASPATESGPSLWGSLDFEHRLGDGQTTARVSGERLTARSETDSLLLGVGGIWRRGDLEIHASLSAREELGSGGEEYGATFSLDLQF